VSVDLSSGTFRLFKFPLGCRPRGKVPRNNNEKSSRIMNLNWKEFTNQRNAIRLISLLLAVLTQFGITQVAQGSEEDTSRPVQQFGGPGSVPGQLIDDESHTQSITGRKIGQRYSDWKAGVKKNRGLNFTVDYSMGLNGATNTLGEEDTFAGGAVRFFGTWDLVGRESGNTGSFVFKVEHRHKYTDIPPNGLASEIGFVGTTMPNFSDIGSRLTNLYWKQNLNQGRLEIIGGMIDTTDWVDLYALASPWTGFQNFVFATGGATIPVPDDAALGAYVNAMLTDNLYISGGFADSNADSTDPGEGFDTFGDHEFFKTIELGVVTSPDRFYFDNTHITYWHADERVTAGVVSGHGFNFSFEHAIDDKWLPFLRAGYADEGGTLLQKTLSLGFGYHFGDNNSLFGLGVNWGEPNEDTFGSGLSDQYTLELFSRLQVMQNLQVTPDIQYIKDPARNTQKDHSWLFGLRARMYF
jgi:porin